MKKIVLLLAIMLVSQNIFAQGFNIGIKGGVGLNYSTGSDAKSLVDVGQLNMAAIGLDKNSLSHNQMGSIRGNVGLLVGYDFTDHVGLISNIFFGIRNARSVGDVDHSVMISYNSIDADLMLKLMIPLNFGRLYFAGGPTVMWGVSKVRINENSNNGDSTIDIKKDYNHVYTNPLVGMAAEIGVEIDAGIGAILLGLRSQWNIFNMAPSIKVKQHLPLAFQTGYIFKF